MPDPMNDYCIGDVWRYYVLPLLVPVAEPLAIIPQKVVEYEVWAPADDV
jgi:hypothetical protein